MGITRLRVEIGLVDLSDCMAHLSAQTVFSRCYARQIRPDLPLQIMNRHHSQPFGIRQ